MASVTMDTYDNSEVEIVDSDDDEDQDWGDDSEDPGLHSDLSELEDEQGPSSSSLAAKDISKGYRVLGPEEMHTLQEAALQQVCDLLHCSRTVARSILIQYRWDAERAIGVGVEKGLDELYKSVGLPLPSDTPATPVQGTVQCVICCENVDARQCPLMICGHTFCGTCWTQHFKTGISEGKARNLRCMAYKCGAPCDEAVVKRLLKGTPEGARFDESLSTSYIEDNSMACFCPSVPWCGNAVVVHGDPICEPVCTCGHSFCFKCKRNPHSPCTCAMWDAWEEKTQGDSETRNWMVANTKPCPKCKKPVEKNGGCNHVTCKCGQSFCWLCGSSTGMAHTYSSIEGHSCGRFRDEIEKKQSAAAASHKRYMFYFERYKGHTDSYTKECDKRATLQERIAQQVISGTDDRSYDWLISAMDQLEVARRVLAPSYVFAYFTFGNDMFKDDFTPAQNAVNQNLFEDQQQMLESEVERLSNLINSCSNKLALTNGEGVDDAERIQAINSTVNIERRIQKFYEMVQEILDQLQTCTAHIASFVPRK